MEEERMRTGLLVMLLMAGLIFVGLAGRLVYLGSSIDRVISANGLELEMFHQYPPLTEAGAKPGGRPRQVRVPALAGKSFADAGDALVGTGLLLEGMGDAHGKVTRQEPPAGRTVPEGTSVRVWMK